MVEVSRADSRHSTHALRLVLVARDTDHDILLQDSHGGVTRSATALRIAVGRKPLVLECQVVLRFSCFAETQRDAEGQTANLRRSETSTLRTMMPSQLVNACGHPLEYAVVT